jgi:hypothetical protein
MRRWLLLLGAALVGSVSTAHAQNSRDVTYPGYLVIRVVLDAGGAAAPVGGAPPGAPGDGGEGQYGPGSGAPPGDSGTPGSFGFGGPMGGGPPRPAGADAVKSIYVVAPFRSINFKLLYTDRRPGPNNPVYPAAKTKYGTTYLYHDGTSVFVEPLREDAKGTIQRQLDAAIQERYRKWTNNRTFDPIFELTLDALAAGMIDDAFKYANETLTLMDVFKDKTPPQKVLDFAKAWKAVAAKLDAAATQPNDAEEWRSRLSAAAVKNGKHYSIVYWGDRQINPAEIDRRLNALERNMKAFYLWHALQGITLSVPDKPMVVILTDRVTDVTPLHNKLDGLALQSDAFYSPSHDVLVLSPERMDQLGAAFADMARASYKNGWSRDELLKGIPPTGGQKQSPQELARMMTLALVDKLLEEEMDHSAMSREASRQLYVASGLIPKNVQLPHWTESGISSFMQHPKGPMFVKDSKGGQSMVVGLAFGYGSPNYILHRHYKELDKEQGRQLHPKAEELLKNVLTDRYFEGAKTGVDPDPPPAKPTTNPGEPNGPTGPGFGPMGGGGFRPGGSGRPPGGGGPGAIPPGGPGEEGESYGPGGAAPGGTGGPVVLENEAANKRNARERLQTKADATAWALTYYLSRGQMYGVQKYYAELRRMPRDMRLDEQFVLKTFCKCFNLMDKQKPEEIDQAAFKNFAETWVRSMRNVPVYGVDLPLQASSSGGGNPGGAGPMGPGGAGGRPGGPGGAPGGSGS